MRDAREDAVQANHREHVQKLEDQIVLLKVEPQVAVASAVDGFAPSRQFTLYDNDEDLEKSLKELE